MPPRFSIWMVLAAVAAGVIAGYLAGSGLIGNAGASRDARLVKELRGELAKTTPAEGRAEALRAFDQAAMRVRKAGR